MKKWRGKGQLFLTVKVQRINVEGMMEIEKHHLANASSSCFWQEPTMVVKISGWIYDEKQNIHILPKYHPTIINYKGTNFKAENLPESSDEN